MGDMMCLRLQRMREEESYQNYKGIWNAAGSLNDSSRDRQSIVDSIVANLETREQIVSNFLIQQGWQSMPFVKDYLESYRKAIEHVLGEDIEAILRWVRWESPYHR